MVSSTELREQLTSGLDDLSIAEAHEEFSERLDNFLEQNNIEESEIISGESEYAPILSEAAFNDLDFRGMEGTGLSLADARRMMTDDTYKLEMAEDYLTGNAEERIEKEYTEYSYNPNSRLGLPRAKPLSNEGVEAINEAVRTKEFMHYEMRDALNAGPDGAPETLDDFKQSADFYKWQEMKGDQAAFHQNGGAKDLKFIHPDGRELVYDGDTNELMTDDRYMGTYNYVNATIPADTTPGPIEAYLNTRTEGSRLHKAYDVDTWIELGNTRADRDAHGGEAARQAQMKDAIIGGFGNSVGNTVDETRDSISDKANQAGQAFSDIADDVRDAVQNKIKDITPWQEGALNPSHQNINEAHIQKASLSTTGSGTVYLEDAIGMLAADQKTLNEPTASERTLPIRDALNHPDAAQMFQNLQTHGIKTLTAEITPDMSSEDRVRELLLAGKEATQQVGIPMPSEQRELEAAQELNNSYEDGYSYDM